MRILCEKGDITTVTVDAIVNAANSSLLGGGGVDGAIHRAAGAELLDACREVRRAALPDGLPTGQAVATSAFDLPAHWVIHTVGPDRRAGQTDPALLESAYATSLTAADDLGARTVAFPAISAGAYGWTARESAVAASRALEAQPEFGRTVEEVRFVLFSDDALAAFQGVFGAKP